MKRILIIGASGHGKVVADIAKDNGYEEIVFADDDSAKKHCGKYSVIGDFNVAYGFDGDVIIAIGNATTRRKLQEKLEMEGVRIATLIHSSAIISEDVIVGVGTVIMPGCVINAATEIGDGCIVNTGASIDHDCFIGDFVHISVGSHLAGNVYIGDSTWIGIGSCISNGITISKNCQVGAGAVVVKDIKESGTYVGCPARKIK